MSYLLDAVTEAAAHRQESETEYRRAVLRAREQGHSLREIARAAGLTHNAIVNVLRREEQRKP